MQSSMKLARERRRLGRLLSEERSIGTGKRGGSRGKGVVEEGVEELCYHYDFYGVLVSSLRSRLYIQGNITLFQFSMPCHAMHAP